MRRLLGGEGLDEGVTGGGIGVGVVVCYGFWGWKGGEGGWFGGGDFEMMGGNGERWIGYVEG